VFLELSVVLAERVAVPDAEFLSEFHIRDQMLPVANTLNLQSDRDVADPFAAAIQTTSAETPDRQDGNQNDDDCTKSRSTPVIPNEPVTSAASHRIDNTRNKREQEGRIIFASTSLLSTSRVV
jgi:hypothetical protein